MGAVAVIGGSGFIGRHVAAALFEAGHQVSTPSHVEFDIARDDTVSLSLRLAGVDIVVNCAGLARDAKIENLTAVNAEGAVRLGEACARAGVRRYIHISALGAGGSGASRFQDAKARAERELSAIEGVELVIVRPSLVLGAGGAAGDFFCALAALPIIPRLGDGAWRVQPIHVSELAELLTGLVAHPNPPASLDAVGPTPISTDELTDQSRQWLGLSSRPALKVPAAILGVFAWMNEVVEVGPGDREFLRLLEQGNTGDPGGMSVVMGRRPLSVEQSFARRPAVIADIWRARLYFVHPLLRLTLAALWFGTGLVSFGLFPPAEFYVMLGELGLTGPIAEVALFGMATINIILGGLLIANWRPTFVAEAMLGLLIVFSIAALALPHEYWLTPFAPILKNMPIGVALLAFIGMEPPQAWRNRHVALAPVRPHSTLPADRLA